MAVRVSPERPLGLFREYWKDPEATAGAFRGDWYYTGDRAEVDEDGYFWFVGRSDDVIISAAYRVGPLEELVAELPKTISGKIRRVELREREIAISGGRDPD